MKLLLIIKADTNDADYVTASTYVTPEALETLLPVFAAIKACKQRHNWPMLSYSWFKVEDVYEDVLSPEQIELFNDYAPCGEYGIHTIKSIKVYEVESEANYL